jgi:hypothetical protein
MGVHEDKIFSIFCTFFQGVVIGRLQRYEWGNSIGPIDSLSGRRRGASIFLRAEFTRSLKNNGFSPPPVNEILKTEAACAIQS